MEESIQFKTYQETLRARNMHACNSLLSRLARYHGEAFVKVEAVVLVEAAPEPELPPPPVDPKWIRMIEDAPDPKGPSVREIKLCVAQHYGVSPLDMESPRRNAKFVVPRQVAFYLCRKLTARSFPEIGRKFGNRDHSTILWGAKMVEKRMKADLQLARTVRALEAQFQ